MIRALAILLLVGLAAPPVRATVYAPMDDATLATASAAIVTGTVIGSTARRVDGRIVTETTVAVDRVYKGAVRGMTVTVTTPGGRLGDETVVVHGAPSFADGEDVLLHLQPGPRGRVRTTALGLGAHRLTIAVDGSVLATQMAPTREQRRLEDVAATVQALGDPGSPVGDGADPDAPVTAQFTLLGSRPGRWFQPDTGDRVRLSVANADANLGPGTTTSVIDAAMAAWNGVSTAAIELVRGGTAAPGPSVAGGNCDTRSVIQFNDPEDEIGSLVNCTGILAVGGFCSRGDVGVLNGTTFIRISEGDLTVANGLANCFGRRGFEEIVTHEIGHVIGLGHSSENPSESNATLRDATMFFLAHFDGRGAAVRTDDIAGVSYLYPSTVDPNDLDGDGVANAADACPSTPERTPVDLNGCACGEDGHVACDDGLACTDDRCDPATGRCATGPTDCTGGDPCVTGACDEVAGCSTTPVAGDAAVICVYKRAYPPGTCSADRVPGAVRKLLRQAARLVELGLQRDDVRRLEKADRKLARARVVIDKAASRRRTPLGSVCAGALGGLVDEARSRLVLPD